MLFSAGTFLYVATVHVLAELMQKGPEHSYNRLPNTESSGRIQQSHSKLRNSELLALILGCLTPLILTFIHHHDV